MSLPVNINEISPIDNHIQAKRSAFVRLKHWIIHLNIYNQESTLTIDEQRLATRLNLTIFTIILLILIFFRTFAPQTTIITVQLPSSSQYKHLSNVYSSTLSCPCSRVIVPYGSFISFSPKFHQICSSYFVSSIWIEKLFSMNMSRYHPLDFRNSGSSQFQILALFCRFAIQAVSNALNDFSQENFINSHAISPDLLNTQIDASIKRLQTTTIANIKRIDEFIILAMESNRLESTLQTNFIVLSVPGARVYYTHVSFYLEDDYIDQTDESSYCSCETSSNCTYPASFYTRSIRTSNYYGVLSPILFTIPGHYVGCLPRSAILRATLECFYDKKCLDILDLVGVETSDAIPLNRSIPSRFPIGSTIQTIFNELFVEEWGYMSQFDHYFNTCAPLTCSYTYVPRLNTNAIFSTVVSLLGGLIVICRLGTYIFVLHAIRKIRMRGRQSNIQMPQRMVNRNIRENLVHNLRQSYQVVLGLNLFNTSTILSNANQKRWATRIYIVFLTMGFSILTIYSTVNQSTITVVIQKPSRDDFESFHTTYSLTLFCPCTQLSVLQADIIHIQPQFHPVCSSDFIREDRWFLYFKFIKRTDAPASFTYYSQDFRFGPGFSMFLLLRTLCRFANDTVQNSIRVFNNTQFISNEALPELIFRQRTDAILNKWKDQTLNSFLSLFSLVRSMIEDNQLHVSTDTSVSFRSYFVDGFWLLRLYTQSYISRNGSVCFCCLNSNCRANQGFFCHGSACEGGGTFPNQTVPGLYLSCFPFNSLLMSTLECFYNASCIQMLLDWRLFEVGQAFEARHLNITPIQVNLSYTPFINESINNIVSRLFIDQWEFSSDPLAHYQQCKPSACTYTYVSNFEPANAITSVIGLIGGLSIVLRFIVPILTRIIAQTWRKRNREFRRPNATNTGDNEIIRIGIDNLPDRRATGLRSVRLQIRESVRTMDFFPERVTHSLWATRIYILLFILCFFIILVVTAFSYITWDISIQSPSESIFLELYQSHYSHRLSCRCSHSAITYRSFLNVSVQYHQVCSSYFVTLEWWTLLISKGYDLLKYTDHAILSNHFRMLSSFCRLSKDTIDYSITALLADSFISIEALAPNDFQNQVNSILRSFVQRITSDFVDTIDYIADMFRSNQLEHIFLSNWMISFSSSAENYVLSSTPRSYNNDTCTCAKSMNNSCWWPLTFTLNNQRITTMPTFVGGCLPVDGIRLSTLECLYDVSCIEKMRELILLSKQTGIQLPLKRTIQSRFSPKTTVVNTIIKELFVEEWSNSSNYSLYYDACAPRTCRYSYSERSPLSYMVTKFFGTYGGVTLCLRLLIIGGFKLIDGLQSHFNQ